MTRSRIFFSFFAMFVLITIYSVQAMAGPGSCEGFDIPQKDGEADWVYAVKVIRQNATVYENPTSSSALKTLDFDLSLSVVKVSDSRLQVKKLSDKKPLGWVNRSDLLCGFKPLKGDSGLEQKFYIKTGTEVRGDKPSTVKAYASPDLNTCSGKCRELSRFSGYFVFDKLKDDSAYLLSENYDLDYNTRLVGWVSKKNGFIWDTAYGLRPKENLIDESGNEKTVCAYSSLNNAIAGKGCQPILGGDRWYLSEHRIPILYIIEYKRKSFYKVILIPNNLIFNKSNEKHKIITLSNENLKEKNDTIIEGYIPVSEDVTEDVWLTSEDLLKWIELLENIGYMSYYSTKKFREALIVGIVGSLEQAIRKPLYEYTDESLEKFLERKGSLPVREQSPLFRYSIDDLRDKNKVPDCELIRLVHWLDRIRQMMSIVALGEYRPTFKTEKFPGECPSGQNIPFISDIDRKPFRNSDMSYSHRFQKANVFWVPKEFLP